MKKSPKHKPIDSLNHDPRVQATTTMKRHSLRHIYIFGHMILATWPQLKTETIWLDKSTRFNLTDVEEAEEHHVTTQSVSLYVNLSEVDGPSLH